ncbi:1090_t:CDS:10, partial [Acaulospora colombiana]
NYIAYKTLKKLIKKAEETKSQYDYSTDDNIIAFFFLLDRELEKVNAFFLYKRAEIERRLRILSEKYCYPHSNGQDDPAMGFRELENGISNFIPNTEIDSELLPVLLETKEQINKIFGFADINKKGFDKILKKFDKKLGGEAQRLYLNNKVNVLPFASSSMLGEVLDLIEQWIVKSEKVNHSGSESRSKPSTGLTEEHNKILLDSIEKDDANSLQQLINKVTMEASIQSSSMKRMLTSMLHQASFYRAPNCIRLLLKSGAGIIDEEEINQRSLVHKLAMHGRCLPAEKGFQLNDLTSDMRYSHTSLSFTNKRENCVENVSDISVPDADDPEIISIILEHLPPTECFQASMPDVFGRRPLHYSAMNGFLRITKILLEYLIKTKQLDKFEDPAWFDNDGYTPFFYAVSRGHTKVVECIIEVCRIKSVDVVSNESTSLSGIVNTPAVPTVAAAQQILIPSSYYTSHNTFAHSYAQTPLALSCRLGHCEMARLLLSYGANPDVQDEEGETALHLAARNGYYDCVRILLGLDRSDEQSQSRMKKANTEIKEKFYGWTPLFLAAVDGHAETVEILIQAGADANVFDSRGWTPHMHAIFRGHIFVKNILQPLTSPYELDNFTPMPADGDVKSSVIEYGHKYLQDQSLLFVTLGSTDARKSVVPVKLDAIIDLPLKDNSEIDQLAFYIPHNADNVTLSFDILPTFRTKKQLIGKATFIISSLMGSATVPILGTRDLDVIGIIEFEFFVVNPFNHAKLSVGSKHTYWKSMTTQVIGHRGMGANSAEKPNLQLGENTLMSFITAASLGAEYIEFDVQLTKDHVPVIYHDWTVTETGYDIPMHSMTLKQFQKLKYAHTRLEEILTQDRNIRDEFQHSAYHFDSIGVEGVRKINMEKLKRSNSEGSISPYSQNQLVKDGKFKGNGVGTIQAPFATLAETFLKVPLNIGFNIEVKYPMVDEIEDDDLPAFGDINFFLDTILRHTYENAQDRKIIFSSFHPNICLGLSFKQPNYPAIRFAKLANLLGIVAKVNPIIEAPKLVNAVREAGLLMFTYGDSNNEVSNVRLQRKAGVDAVIVDSVLAVRRGLQQNE